MTYSKTLRLFTVLLICSMTVSADIVFDYFDNDRSHRNGAGLDTYWNPPGDPAYLIEIETQKVHEGTGALKVTWDNKNMWSNFLIANLDKEGNAGLDFQKGDAVRMAIAGPAERVIFKLTDSDGTSTGDLASQTALEGDEYQIFEFPYFTAAEDQWPDLDLFSIAEIALLPDAGTLGSSGTIYIDTIELILGSGEDAEVVGVVDNFDNDTSIEDDPAALDSIPSSFSLLPDDFAPYQFSVVDDPAGGENAVLQIDYNNSPWSVIFIGELDVTDWSMVDAVSIDLSGTVGGLLMKLQFDDSTESPDLTGGFQRHDGDQWDTLIWSFDAINNRDKLSAVRSLLFFIEGPTAAQGTIFVDNITLLGTITDVNDWELF